MFCLFAVFVLVSCDKKFKSNRSPKTDDESRGSSTSPNQSTPYRETDNPSKTPSVALSVSPTLIEFNVGDRLTLVSIDENPTNIKSVDAVFKKKDVSGTEQMIKVTQLPKDGADQKIGSVDSLFVFTYFEFDVNDPDNKTDWVVTMVIRDSSDKNCDSTFFSNLQKQTVQFFKPKHHNKKKKYEDIEFVKC
jgi:hypothetical protein